jgi:hypothetical protein
MIPARKPQNLLNMAVPYKSKSGGGGGGRKIVKATLGNSGVKLVITGLKL